MKLLLLILAIASTACTSVTRMGENDEIIVKTYTGLFAPSVTQIEDTRNGNVLNYPGTSAIGQLAGPAALFGGMYTLGGIGKTTNTTNVTGAGSSINSTNSNTSGASSSATSHSQSQSVINP